MKKLFKALAILLAFLLLIIVLGIGYVTTFLPDVGEPPAIKVQGSPDNIERGRYLANSVAVCIDCHSKRDWSQFAGPIIPGSEGGGGELFDQKFGFPGSFYAKNITPHHLADWTDGEIYRTITTGVNKYDDPLFPVMPYHYYGKMDPEDVKAIIAYIRTLSPIRNEIPKSKADFPMNLIIHMIPHPAEPHKRPSESNTVAYGGYLVNMAGCVECHTKDDKGQIIKGLEFGGGRQFSLSFGVLQSANITPDPETGIGNWTREQFVQKFKQYEDTAYHSPKLSETDRNTIMPWRMYAKMTESDLAAIYEFLKTVKPMKNQVERYIKAAK